MDYDPFEVDPLVTRPGPDDGFTIMLDLLTWGTEWESFWREDPLKRGAAVPSVVVDMHSNDEISIPSLTQAGRPCPVGSACYYEGLQTVHSRLGDATGNNPWGNCVATKPYSVAHCKDLCYRSGVTSQYSTPTEWERGLCSCMNGVFRGSAASCDQDCQCRDAMQRCSAHIRQDVCEKCYPSCQEKSWKQTLNSMGMFGGRYRIVYMMQDRMVQWVTRLLEVAGLHPLVFKHASYTAMTKKASTHHITEYADQNFVVLKVFVGSTEVESISESQSISFATVLGGIGGNAGLTIGVSFMTVVEWLEFSLTALMVYFVYQHKVGGKSDGPGCVEETCHKLCG